VHQGTIRPVVGSSVIPGAERFWAPNNFTMLFRNPDDDLKEAVFEHESRLLVLKKGSLQSADLSSLYIPASLVKLGSNCLSNNRMLGTVIFAGGSQCHLIGK
jgi:hypothetical protein